MSPEEVSTRVPSAPLGILESVRPALVSALATRKGLITP